MPILPSFFIALLSGFFLSFVLPDIGFSLACWVGIVPLLIIIRKKTPLQIYGLSCVAGLVLFARGYYWISNLGETYLGLVFPFNIGLMLLFAFFMAQPFALMHILYAWLQKHTSEWFDLLLYPSIAVSVWTLFPTLFKTNFLFIHYPPLLAVQAIEFTGAAGLTWMVFFTNGLIKKLLFPQNQQQRRFDFTCGLLVLGAWFGWGWWSYQDWQRRIDSFETRNIGIVQPNRQASFSLLPPLPGYKTTYPLEFEMTKKADANQADIIIWPEGKNFNYSYNNQIKKAFQEFGREITADILFQETSLEKNIETHSINPYNSMYLLRKGAEEDIYHKNILVPFGEYIPFSFFISPIIQYFGFYFQEYAAGTSPKVFFSGNMRITPLICYESIYPYFVADSVNLEGAHGKVIVVVTQDGWYKSLLQVEEHSASTALRAIENRVPVIHVVNNGYSSITLPDGSVFFRSPYEKRGTWVIPMPYDSESGGSFYSRHPWFFLSVVYLFIAFNLVLPINRLIMKKS